MYKVFKNHSCPFFRHIQVSQNAPFLCEAFFLSPNHFMYLFRLLFDLYNNQGQKLHDQCFFCFPLYLIPLYPNDDLISIYSLQEKCAGVTRKCAINGNSHKRTWTYTQVRVHIWIRWASFLCLLKVLIVISRLVLSLVLSAFLTIFEYFCTGSLWFKNSGK